MNDSPLHGKIENEEKMEVLFIEAYASIATNLRSV